MAEFIPNELWEASRLYEQHVSKGGYIAGDSVVSNTHEAQRFLAERQQLRNGHGRVKAEIYRGSNWALDMNTRSLDGARMLLVHSEYSTPENPQYSHVIVRMPVIDSQREISGYDVWVFSGNHNLDWLWLTPGDNQRISEEEKRHITHNNLLTFIPQGVEIKRAPEKETYLLVTATEEKDRNLELRDRVIDYIM